MKKQSKNYTESIIRSIAFSVINEEFAVKSNWFKEFVDQCFKDKFKDPEEIHQIQRQFRLHHPEQIYNLSSKNKCVLVFGSLEKGLAEFKQQI